MARPVKHYGRWRIRWIDGRGGRQSKTYDDYNTAKKALARYEHEAEQVRLGLKRHVTVHKKFDELCDYWIENKAPAKRSGKDDVSLIKKHLRPFFGSYRLREINVAHSDRYIVKKQHLNNKTINNHLTLFIAMLNRAVDLGWLETCPRIYKPKVRLFNRDYRYLRTAEEIQRFLLAALDEGEQVYVLFSTAVYTGCRAGEIAALQWDDIDFDKRLITVQRSYDGPTKADDVRYVPILDPLLPILRNWRLRHPGNLVFTNRAGNMFGPSSQIFQEVLHRILATAELPMLTIQNKQVRYITFHCLRHHADFWIMPR